MNSVTWEATCRFCDAQIYFNSLVVNDRTGNALALNADDSSIHRCREANLTDEERIQSVLRYIRYQNSKLTTAQLSLSRQPRA